MHIHPLIVKPGFKTRRSDPQAYAPDLSDPSEGPLTFNFLLNPGLRPRRAGRQERQRVLEPKIHSSWEHGGHDK